MLKCIFKKLKISLQLHMPQLGAFDYITTGENNACSLMTPWGGGEWIEKPGFQTGVNNQDHPGES